MGLRVFPSGPHDILCRECSPDRPASSVAEVPVPLDELSAVRHHDLRVEAARAAVTDREGLVVAMRNHPAAEPITTPPVRAGTGRIELEHVLPRIVVDVDRLRARRHRGCRNRKKRTCNK